MKIDFRVFLNRFELLLITAGLSRTSDFSMTLSRADDVMESRSASSRMLTHRTATVMSSVSPFVCGPPLYLWQALHFLLQAERVFAARWFQRFRALCPCCVLPFERVGGETSEEGPRRQADGEKTN